jgi:hypothetical protein
MIIMVPVNGERSEYGLSDRDMFDIKEERRMSSRATFRTDTDSIAGDLDGGFGLKSGLRRGRGDPGTQLYAEYLRHQGSRSGSRNESSASGSTEDDHFDVESLESL